MKLLLDENLSPRLAAQLDDLYPGSTQIECLGLRGASDTQVWEYAKVKDYVLVSKDNVIRRFLSSLCGKQCLEQGIVP